MRTREIANDDRPSRATETAELHPSANRKRAEDLLRVGDDAIQNALSDNATQYLAASRQIGGQ